MKYELQAKLVRGKAGRQVRELIKEHHYLHSAPSAEFTFAVMLQGKEDELVVWEQLVGGALYGGGLNRNLGSPYGLDHTGVCELVRLFIMDDVKTYIHNGATQVLGQTLKWLERNTDKHLVIAFSDPVAEHTGTVYRASNWSYLGETGKKNVYVVDGVVVEGRTLHEILGSTDSATDKRISKLTGIGLEKKQVPAKFRYGYIISSDKHEKQRLQQLLKAMEQEFPKEPDDSAVMISRT